VKAEAYLATGYCVPLPAKRAMRSDAIASRERFLDAAANLYVDLGYGGCTIRLIAQEAKTSLARLNRHWEGKVQLFEDVFARHCGEIHAAQMAALQAAAETRHDDPRALFAEIIRAFFGPVFAGSSDSSTAAGRMVYCRALVDPAPEVRRIVRDLTAPMAERMADMLRATMPDADPQAFVLSVSVVFGSYIHSQLFGDEMAASMGQFSKMDWSKAVDVLTGIFINGLPVGRNVVSEQT